MYVCASSGSSTRWRAAVLTWKATQSRKRRRLHWSSKRRRQQQWQRRQQQPTARPSRKRAVTVGAAAVEAAVRARMKEKYSSRAEMEGVARLDPTSLLVALLYLLALFFPELSGLQVLVLPFPLATCSTSPCQYWPSRNGGWKDLFQLGFFSFFFKQIRFLFYL